MNDETEVSRSGCFGFWLEALFSWTGLAVWIPVLVAVRGAAVADSLWEPLTALADPGIELLSMGLAFLGLFLTAYRTYDRDMRRAQETLDGLRKEKLIRPEIGVSFQKGSEYVPQVRTKAIKQEVVAEREKMQREVEEYEERIQDATEVIEELKQEDDLRASEKDRLERAREKRETAQEHREKWRDIRRDSIAEKMREVRKGRLYIDFHFRVENESQNVPATLLNVTIEPCEADSNRFTYLPQETSSKQATEGGEVRIEPNTSAPLTHTAELRVPGGDDFDEFLETLASLDDGDRDCLRFELAFRGHEESYTVVFEKTIYLLPMCETLLEHWEQHDFEEALDVVEGGG